MTTMSPISTAKAAIAKLQEDGQESVEVSALLLYLESLEDGLQHQNETRRLKHESNLAHYKAKAEVQLANFEAVMAAGRSALSTSILVNGGASVALLSLLGSLAGKAPQVSASPKALAFSLASFAIGVMAGAVATGCTYVTQYCYSKYYMRMGIAFHVATMLLVILSYGCFLTGSYFAYENFVR